MMIQDEKKEMGKVMTHKNISLRSMLWICVITFSVLFGVVEPAHAQITCSDGPEFDPQLGNDAFDMSKGIICLLYTSDAADE